MPPAAALQFPVSDSALAEWGEEEELRAAAIGSSARRLAALQNGLRIGQPDGSPTDIASLKAEVAMVVAGGRGAGPAWPTGVALLDAALGGGVPRGRVTEVVGPLGAGKTSLVRQLVARVLQAGGWVAWIDATRTLAPQELAGLGERLIAVRPRDHTRGAWCADLLLRSGVFALVVLDGAPVLSRTVGVRLSQLARERDAAFVVLREGTQGSRLGGAVRLQVRPLTQSHTLTHTQSKTPLKMQSKMQKASMPIPMPVAMPIPMPIAMPVPMSMTMQMPVHAHSSATQRSITNERSFSVLVEKGGSYQTVEVTCAIVVARRVCADTEIPDRRGVARRTRVVTGAGSEHAPSNQQPSHESIRANAANESTRQFEQQPIAAGQSATDAATGRQHTHKRPTDTQHPEQRQQVTRKHPGDSSWKGRGRPRMAESNYGRSTRRGKAREFLHTRQRTEEQEQQRQIRRDSRRQSQHELRAISLGQLPASAGRG